MPLLASLVAMLRLLLLLSALVAAPATAQSRQPLVLAASSLQEAMDEAAESWARQGHARPVISYAGSSALARQIAAGAPADLFASADLDWMEDVRRRGLIARGTVAAFARNQLVVVARPGTRGVGGLRGAALGRQLAAGALAMADPAAVPAGKYGKAALSRLGAWSLAAPRVVRAENVRAALALVERGAATYGVVYATDALASPKVRVVGTFPASSHPPIIYPIARLAASRNADAEAFRRFLLSAGGKVILRRHGFTA